MSYLSRKQLGEKIAAFLAWKRAMGSPYLSGEKALRSFESFAARISKPSVRVCLATAIPAWLERGHKRNPVTLNHELAPVRQFCLYLRRFDATAYVPPVSLAPVTNSNYVPYVLSRDEIHNLIEVAGLPRRGAKLWPGVLRMLLITMYCTGARTGETARLKLNDFDRTKRVLHIRDSKGRSRDLPYRQDLARQFDQYLRERTAVLRAHSRDGEPALFVDSYGHAVTPSLISTTIGLLMKRLDMKGGSGRSKPRAYSLRHTFAVHRLTSWYHDGHSVDARLPWLSAYMGHIDLLGTEVYLKATPELLGLASKRFSARFSKSGKSS